MEQAFSFIRSPNSPFPSLTTFTNILDKVDEALTLAVSN